MVWYNEMWNAFLDILKSPFYNPSIWWYLAPVFLLWFILEIYFGEYKKEQLGWNTSLGNGISLLWINIETMRFLFSKSDIDLFWLRFFFILIILIYACFIIYISFTHKYSAKTTYLLASPTPIYYLSTISILWGHGNLKITLWVLLDLIILYGLVVLFFYLLRKYLPESEKDEEEDDSFNSSLDNSSSDNLDDDFNL